MVEVEEIEKGEKRRQVGEDGGGMRFWVRDEAVWATGELVVGLGEVRKAAKEGLLAMSVAVGLKVMAEMMEEEVTRKVGPKHAKLTERRASRHASAPGSVVLGGRRIKVRRPTRGPQRVPRCTSTPTAPFLTTTSSQRS